MAERLFTEAQWRAISTIEELSDSPPYGLESEPKKRVFGPLFSDGEYYLSCSVPDGDFYRRNGPPEPAYIVFEYSSGLVITRPVTCRVEALAGARRRISAIGDFYQEMLAEGRVWMAEKRAKEEAEQAVRAAQASAKRERRARSLSKRARAVFAASEGKCHYCETALTLDGKWHIEHKFPRALFGGSEQSNLVAACAPCNIRKRDKTDLEFIAAQAAKAST